MEKPTEKDVELTRRTLEYWALSLKKHEPHARASITVLAHVLVELLEADEIEEL